MARQAEGARILTLTTGACFVAAMAHQEVLLATHWAFVRP